MDIAVHKSDIQEDGSSREIEVDLMADLSNRRAPSRPTYEAFAEGGTTPPPVPEESQGQVGV
ncbi:MAG: hypothetical protein ACFCBU_05660 [Cyanophyceae cyanobacterium]